MFILRNKWKPKVVQMLIKCEAWLCISDIAKWCYATFELGKISQLQEIILKNSGVKKCIYFESPIQIT